MLERFNRKARPQQPVSARRGYEVISAVDDARFENLGSRKILLVGEPVFTSLRADTHPSNFVSQPAREGAGFVRTLVAKSSPKIHVAVDERLFKRQRHRFALALDGYLSWGFSQRDPGTLILLGGGASADNGTNVDVLVFQGGVIHEVNEKHLPSAEASSFVDALENMIATLRNSYPTARIVQAAPLANWGLHDVAYIGDAPLKRLSFRPLVRSYAKGRAYWMPAGIAAAGVVVYCGLLMFGWGSYNGALSKYETAITDAAIRDAGGIDTNFLDIMNARRFYMEQPRRQVRLTQEAIRVVRGIGIVPDVQIVELKLPAPALDGPRANGNTLISPEHTRQRNQIMPDRTPDVWMAISVPRQRDTAILQAKDVMTSIANSTGMSLRLSHQGWREDAGATGNGARRIFNIEGFIHD
ncbi:hypothetical protein [Castellaniella sp.]|uniref:hypothetical protein n=1 Tax=Castellaniella sp. TaxID=1955812 RepID=UPI002AFECCEC|nr:hypothetical protein [Castellaniella sp.]